MSYRVEVALSARAVCQATTCKNDKIKIAKGELRNGTLVMFNEHQSWKYRHWGCVTPTVLHNWWETAEKNLELIDGFDELPDELKTKVQRALEVSHVDDEDWNGDDECNRYDPNNKSQGMFLKGARLKEKLAREADKNTTPAEKAPSKKRAKATAEDDSDIAQKPAKKSKTRAKASTDLETEPVAKKSKARAKKSTLVEDEDEDTQPAPKKTKKTTTQVDTTQAKPAKKGKAKNTTAETDSLDDAPEPAPQKRSRVSKKKTAEAAEVHSADEAEVAKPKAKTVRRKKIASNDED